MLKHAFSRWNDVLNTISPRRIIELRRHRALMNAISTYRLSRTQGDPLRLENFGFKVHSQSDEDGILREIFRRIGTTNRVFVEFGAETGQENNCRFLLEQGWTGLWMEGNQYGADGIRKLFTKEIARGQLRFIEAYVSRDNVNALIQQSGIGGEIDLLSIDIDSIDYYVFQVIEAIKPRVVVLEHNHSYPPGEIWVMPYNPNYRWDHTTGAADYGASISALVDLANHKGYQLVGCGLYSPNGFYVRNDLLEGSKFSRPFTAEHFFNPLNAEMIFKFPRSEVS